MYCWKCGAENSDSAIRCKRCNEDFQDPPPGAVPADIGQDAGMRMLLPVGRSPFAIAAGYAGLVSPALCVLGPVAIVLGILAIIDIKRHPERHGMVRAILGIVLGLIGSLMLVMLVLLLLFDR